MMVKSGLILKSDKIAKPKSIKNKISSHVKDGYKVTVNNNKLQLSNHDHWNIISSLQRPIMN